MSRAPVRPLLEVSAALASRDPSALRDALERAASGSDSFQVEEVILQSYLFLGYPASLNAFALWRELRGPAGAGGVEDDWTGWERRGEEVCRVVYGGQYQGLRRNVRELHPEMERWMVVEGYGKVLGRPGVGLATRELCIVALLAVLDAPRQLYSHLRGALNAGAGVAGVEEALAVAERHLGEEGRKAVRKVWARVRERAQEGGVRGEERGEEWG